MAVRKRWLSRLEDEDGGIVDPSTISDDFILYTAS
jgi:hypothetical protein